MEIIVTFAAVITIFNRRKYEKSIIVGPRFLYHAGSGEHNIDGSNVDSEPKV